jgi:hypothetical protein
MGVHKISVVLLALLLAGMAMVPIVNAANADSTIAPQSATTDDTLTISGVSLNVAPSTAFTVDLSKFNKPLTKDQFAKFNQKNIEYLSHQFGKAIAQKMSDDQYGQVTQNSQLSPMYVSPNVLQIWGYDIYLWPYQSQSRSTSDQSASPVNFIVFKNNAFQVENYLLNHGWQAALGWDEWGLHGKSSGSLHWTDSTYQGYIFTQVQQGSYYTNRYHAVLIDADYSNSLGNSWSYGNCHYEYWNGVTHIIYANGWNSGRSQIYSTLSGTSSTYWVALYNSISGYFDGWGLIFIR